MSAPIVRFRCYRCDQLLGVSASKVGRTATCPRCRAELLVPTPEAEPVESVAPESAIEPPAPVPAGSFDFPAQAPSTPERLSGDPVLEFDLGSIEIAPTRLVDPVIRRESSPFRASTDVAPPFSAELLVQPPETAPFIPDEIIAAEIRLDPPRVVDRDIASRRGRGREVTLSPSVVTAWMFFVLLGLALSFVGGLLVGHYLWISPPTATAAARP
ncbi:hypothetical protein EP7_001251 [Isosphaeraceae bacterium EP7]